MRKFYIQNSANFFGPFDDLSAKIRRSLFIMWLQRHLFLKQWVLLSFFLNKSASSENNFFEWGIKGSQSVPKGLTWFQFVSYFPCIWSQLVAMEISPLLVCLVQFSLLLCCLKIWRTTSVVWMCIFLVVDPFWQIWGSKTKYDYWGSGRRFNK